MAQDQVYPSPLDMPSTAPAPAARAAGGVLFTFTATTFLSALLLFSIQPMFAKMVLPVLGGSPSVWAVAMFFFQGALLVGYCYAHFLIAKVRPATSGFIHLALCLLAFVVLPIQLPVWFGEPPAGEPYLWQLGLFTVAVGLPFVAVAANAPLLQAWFSTTGHKQATDPYFLYAASNLGSLIALLGYPFVLEPAFGVRALAGFWTIGFALLVAAIAASFWLVRKAAEPVGAARVAAASEPAPGPAPTWADRAAWVGLALVPSALLTAFTTHITTDVASAPLLWVLPLSLYLLTFVIVFRDSSWFPRPALLALHVVVVFFALLLLSQSRRDGWFVTAPVGMLVFFVSALVAHRTLYEQRPSARHLTEFYLYMSLGGALGGLAAALIAPRLFSEIYEYPLLLALSMACRPGALDIFRRTPAGATPQPGRGRDEWLALWLILAVGILALYWIPWGLERVPPTWLYSGEDSIATRAAWWLNAPLDFARQTLRMWQAWGATSVVVLLLGVIMLVNWRWPARQFMAALMMMIAITTLPSGVRKGDSQRSYFGVYRVSLSADGQWNTLVHGTTLHGAQRVRDSAGNPVADITPATYYHPESPMARSVGVAREIAKARGRQPRFGIIGLGTGSMACHAEAGDTWRFYEIDPLMVEIATKSERFTFLENCQPDADIVIGDARLTVAKERDGSFDLIIVDAFSSDAVPVHLMTAEALAMYVSKIASDGVVLLHISNRYLDLDAVLGATKPLVPGVFGKIISDDAADGSYAQSTSTVAIFARDEATLAKFDATGTPAPMDARGLRGWTDDYSDILGPFRSKYRKRYGTQ
jgi:hypothetical protein